MKIKKLLIGLLVFPTLTVLLGFILVIRSLPEPKISQEQAVHLALSALEEHFENFGVTKSIIGQVEKPILGIWFNEDGQEVMRYHVRIWTGGEQFKAPVSVDVNALSGETYYVEKNPLRRNREINGTFDYLLNRYKNLDLKIKLIVLNRLVIPAKVEVKNT